MAVSMAPDAVDFRAIFDASPNPYLLLDRELNAIGMNEAFLRVTMKRPSDILGRNVSKIFPPNPHDPEGSNLAEARRSFERVLRDRTTDATTLIRHDLHRPDAKDGYEERYWCAVNTPIFGAGGGVSAILNYFVDVTELVKIARGAGRKAAALAETGARDDQVAGGVLLCAHAVHEANRTLGEANKVLGAELHRLRQLFNQAPGYIRIHRGPEHIVELINPAAAELFGARDVLGRPFREAYPELVEQGYLSVLDRVYATGEPHVGRARRILLRRAPGSPPEERYVDFVYQPITEPDESVSGVFVQGSDVTEEQRAKYDLHRYKDHLEELVRERTRALEESEAEVRRTQAELDRAHRLEIVGQLTGGLAHDFNNLLTVVIGNLELIAGLAHDDPRLRSLTERARNAAERGERLTKQLLAFGRRQSLHPEIKDVNQLIHGVTPLIEHAAGARIEIETRLAKDLWPCRIDPGQFETTVLNIVLNARDAIAEHGRIVIETDNVDVAESEHWPDPELGEGPYVRLQIRDTGQGMEPWVAEKAFEPFFTTKEVGAGSGLGLSQVYGFVRQSQGGVWLASTPGEGTTVTILLPKAEPGSAPAAIPVPTTSASARTKDGSGSILLVEDDAAVREVCREALKLLGYEVVVAANGREAMQVLRSVAPVDLLFSDVVMPKGMSGIELGCRAKDIRPGIKILLTSGHAGPHAAAEEIDKNGFKFLPKPFRQAELAEALRQALDAST